MSELTRAAMLRHMRDALHNAGLDSAALDARLLLAAAIGADATELARAPEAEMTQGEIAQAEDFLAQRLAHRPVAKIIRQKEFWGRAFSVSDAVLDPRPDSETLIELALEKCPMQTAFSVLDLGTGSGCLLLTLLAERPHAHGLGVDKSTAALAVAEANAVRLSLSDRAEFAPSDWFENVSQPYHLIVANPPYIETGALARLPEDVRLYDPMAALDGGPDGLEPYRQIVADAASYLEADGWLIFEVGHKQAEAVSALMRRAGFDAVTIAADLAGHQRVVAGRMLAASPQKSAAEK